MSNEETKRAAEVMLEAAKGKKIERRFVCDGGTGAWAPCANPRWDWESYEFRVAPEPFEGWVNVYPDRSALHSTKEAAEAALSPGLGRTIKVREVIE